MSMKCDSKGSSRKRHTKSSSKHSRDETVSKNAEAQPNRKGSTRESRSINRKLQGVQPIVVNSSTMKVSLDKRSNTPSQRRGRAKGSIVYEENPRLSMSVSLHSGKSSRRRPRSLDCDLQFSSPNTVEGSGRQRYLKRSSSQGDLTSLSSLSARRRRMFAATLKSEDDASPHRHRFTNLINNESSSTISDLSPSVGDIDPEDRGLKLTLEIEQLKVLLAEKERDLTELCQFIVAKEKERDDYLITDTSNDSDRSIKDRQC